jgi:hypothetical protein
MSADSGLLITDPSGFFAVRNLLAYCMLHAACILAHIPHLLAEGRWCNLHKLLLQFRISLRWVYLVIDHCLRDVAMHCLTRFVTGPKLPTNAGIIRRLQVADIDSFGSRERGPQQS